MDTYVFGKYSICSLLLTIFIILCLWYYYDEKKSTMIAEPFVAGLYDPEKSSNWVYFPVFGQRMSRTGCVYYNKPFQLNLREYKEYPSILMNLKNGMLDYIAATKGAEVPIPVLPVKPVPAAVPTSDIITSNNPTVENTGKKALVVVPTDDGNKTVVAPVVEKNGESKAIVSVPDSDAGGSNIAVDVPSPSNKLDPVSQPPQTGDNSESFLSDEKWY